MIHKKLYISIFWEYMMISLPIYIGIIYNAKDSVNIIQEIVKIIAKHCLIFAYSQRSYHESLITELNRQEISYMHYSQTVSKDLGET